MDWMKYRKTQWISGMKNSRAMNFDYLAATADNLENGEFFITPHYTKSFTIKKYSVWYQSNEMRANGNNFCLKIKSCKSFEEGKKIAEQFLAGSIEPIGTQYLDNDTYLDELYIS